MCRCSNVGSLLGEEESGDWVRFDILHRSSPRISRFSSSRAPAAPLQVQAEWMRICLAANDADVVRAKAALKDEILRQTGYVWGR